MALEKEGGLKGRRKSVSSRMNEMSGVKESSGRRLERRQTMKKEMYWASTQVEFLSPEGNSTPVKVPY
jgi:hypothetical protein